MERRKLMMAEAILHEEGGLSVLDTGTHLSFFFVFLF
jgi:hypothetical protein